MAPSARYGEIITWTAANFAGRLLRHSSLPFVARPGPRSATPWPRSAVRIENEHSELQCARGCPDRRCADC